MQRKDFIRLSTFAAGAWLLTDVMPLSAAGKTAVLNFSPDPLLKIAETGQIAVSSPWLVFRLYERRGWCCERVYAMLHKIINTQPPVLYNRCT